MNEIIAEVINNYKRYFTELHLSLKEHGFRMNGLRKESFLTSLFQPAALEIDRSSLQ